MHIIDITVELSENVKTYQGDPRVTIEQHATIDQDGYCVVKLGMGSHSGTHLDAPSHYVKDGEPVTQVTLNTLVGKCYVLSPDDMMVPKGARRLLFKGYTDADSTLNERQARALIDAGIKLVGTDSLSIGADEVHRLLLSEGVAVLELLDLSRTQPGPYFLCALPLKVACDGAPVRACLIDQYRSAK